MKKERNGGGRGVGGTELGGGCFVGKVNKGEGEKEEEEEAVITFTTLAKGERKRRRMLCEISAFAQLRWAILLLSYLYPKAS